MIEQATSFLKEAASYTWKVLMALADATIAILLPVYAGIGTFYVTIGYLEYSVMAGLLNTVIMTAAGAGWTVLKVYKTFEQKYGDSE